MTGTEKPAAKGKRVEVRAPGADETGREAAASGRLPVSILTGFLGAGKTTCLNAFLRSTGAAGTAVLVNEFGALDIDGAVLEAGLGDGSRLVALPNGCVCCAVQDDLAAALSALIARRQDQTIARCVIETTGLADPGAIIRGVGHDPRLRRSAFVDQTVTVCAADRIEDALARFPEPLRQIAIADRIIVSKTDIVPDARRDAALARIAAINPAAEIAVAPYGSIEPRRLFARPSAPEHPAMPAAAGHHHAHGVHSFVVHIARPLDPDRFRDVLSFLIMRHAEALLRVKGIVRFAGNRGVRLVNGVHDVFSSEPVDAAGPPPGLGGALVFIGIGLPEAGIRADLASCESAA
ncbi:GTP-binding protein [soil metagenome]